MITATHTPTVPFRRVRATNSTATAAAAPTDLLTLPAVALLDSANGYIDLGTGRATGTTPDFVKLLCYGAGSDNNTGSLRVYGLAPCGTAANSALSFTHVLLGGWDFTLSTDVGVAGGVVPLAERYADTIARQAGIGEANVTDSIHSPANNLKGYILLDVRGFRYLLIDVYRGTATSVNALYAEM